MDTLYLVFGGDIQHPKGGANDFKISFDTEAEAIAFARGMTTAALVWAQVAIIQSRRIVVIWDSRELSRFFQRA